MACYDFLTFGRDWILFASSKSSSKLLEYLRISSGTFAKEQCLLSTNSTCLLQPLNIGIQRNMSQVNLELALSIIFLTRLYTVAYTIRVNLCTSSERNTIFSSKTLFYTVTKTLHNLPLSTIYNLQRTPLPQLISKNTLAIGCQIIFRVLCTQQLQTFVHLRLHVRGR